jgi:hypothetical protein
MSKERVVNQSGASAGRDLIGGDQNIHHHYPAQPNATIVEKLLAKLQVEISDNSQVSAMIDDLRYYYQKKSHDGVTGLVAKLEKAKRSHEIDHALEKKELFAKTLEKWSMYSSAQEIFVFLLARAEVEYRSQVLPEIGTLSEVQLNDRIASRIITPIVEDCGATVFKLNHGTAMGMLYWLAEQCFVRWHK